MKNVVAEYLKKRGMKQVHLAKQLGMTPQSLWDRLQKPEMDTAFLKRVSDLLKHDFFKDISKDMEPQSTGVAEGAHRYGPKRVEDEINDIYREMQRLNDRLTAVERRLQPNT